jgi:pimeloyl-ACP methyl ester carboxylesterase
MKRLIAAAMVSVAFLIGACSGGYGTVGPPDTTGFNGNPGGSMPPPQASSSTALFHPAAGVLPYPTDLYFAGSTDGTLNIQPPNALMPAQPAVNALDGFSTTAAIRERFGGPLNPASLTAASVIVLPVTTDNLTKATTGVLGAPLVAGTDYTAAPATDAGVGPTILEITPLHPLMPSTCIKNGQFLGAQCTTGTGYLVILTSGITDLGGHPAVPDTDYAAIRTAALSNPKCPSITDPTLNGICQLTAAHLAIAVQALHLNPANIVLTFSFTTQSTVDTLELLSATTLAGPAEPIKVLPTGLNTKQVNPALFGLADVYVGTLDIPYYLSKSAPLTASWNAPPFPLDKTSTFVTRFNPLPVPTATLPIPLLVTVPNAASGHATAPAAGWPVVIFQHGITRNREDMFAVADAFAQGGFVVVAIDLPLHGITNTHDPLYASVANPLYANPLLPTSGSIERTFDLDVINNATGAAGPDGVIDPSGSHFINLASLLTSRDNLREGVADLISFAHALPSLNVPGGIDATSIHYVGHSLGGIEGATYLGVVPGALVGSATLGMPGGGLTRLLLDSPSFAPQINAGLAAQGLTPGTTLYAQFFRDSQTVVDAGDPINYFALAPAQHPIHVIQVIGGDAMASGGTFPPDQVVPNSATARLIAVGGLTQVHPPGVAGATPLEVYVNFTAGSHGSLLDPTCGVPAGGTPEPLCAMATVEMQTEAVAFALSRGTQLPVSAAPVVQ